MSALKVVERQFEAYNARDVEAFCATYADDCVIAEYKGAILQNGKAEMRARYAKTFSDFPQNRARSINRMVLGDCDRSRKGRAFARGPVLRGRLHLYCQKRAHRPRRFHYVRPVDVRTPSSR